MQSSVPGAPSPHTHSRPEAAPDCDDSQAVATYDAPSDGFTGTSWYTDPPAPLVLAATYHEPSSLAADRYRLMFATPLDGRSAFQPESERSNDPLFSALRT